MPCFLRVVFAFCCVSMACISTAYSQQGEIIVIDDRQLPADISVGDVFRLVESGAAGKTEITVEVSGSAKLIGSKSIRKYQGGRQLIGEMIKEFEIKAEKKGSAKIKISVKDTIEKKTEVTEIDLQVK